MSNGVWKSFGWISWSDQDWWVQQPSETPPPKSEITYTTIELDINDDQFFYRLVELFAGPRALADLKQSELAQAVWESEGGSYR